MKRMTNLLAKDGVPVSAWSAQQDPFYLQLLARTNADFITLDMQHGMQTENSVIRGIAAVMPSGKPTMVRIPVGRFDLVSRALDAGAHGIIAPMINNLDDAKALVSAAKYIPVGDRSFGPTHGAGLMGLTNPEYVTQANDHIPIMAMIETAEAVSNMDVILDLDGIDGIFLGPGDLSISIRQNVVPDPYGPDTIDIIKTMPEAAHKRGKYAFAWCAGPEHVDLATEIGFDCCFMGHDIAYLQRGIDTMLGEIKTRK
ncbi:HpcH/HpaI aldolase/citrate lyase family protein [Ahrensia sp. R2A130]|uniref:HpcH/HpaI aldolase family protein n=1 Tax=Ahrensia sp. R2A130 TaxID=744979 RepID=UPI0001E0B46C|nr:aldolase/citrate lyase family protein [Ahrensia sp. R2A130]EFL90153.1 HpcH/HpaI aldolase [Ahrensia sp. R2A130]